MVVSVIRVLTSVLPTEMTALEVMLADTSKGMVIWVGLAMFRALVMSLSVDLIF
jgi:hypothetical protein